MTHGTRAHVENLLGCPPATLLANAIWSREFVAERLAASMTASAAAL
jgi:hypothetical protein